MSLFRRLGTRFQSGSMAFRSVPLSEGLYHNDLLVRGIEP
jgi:hypothetical protein